MTNRLAYYGAITAQTWPEGPTPLDPSTASPQWGPGAFTKPGGGVISQVSDVTGSGRSFVASGAARPNDVMIGSLQAIETSATQFMTLSGGIESDLFTPAHWTRYVVVNVKPDDNLPRGIQASPGTMFGLASGVSSGNVYSGGDGLSRGPMSYMLVAGGPHGGEAFPTLVHAFPSNAVKSIVVAAIVFDPNVQIDPGGGGMVRATSSGEMQSDYGDVALGPFTGGMNLGLRGASGFFIGSFVPDWCFPVVHSYRLQQQIRRWFVLAAGLAT
jgi:hypothetical protein